MGHSIVECAESPPDSDSEGDIEERNHTMPYRQRKYTEQG